MTRNWSRRLGAALFAALFAAAAAAANAASGLAGMVQFVRGEVWAQSDGGERRLLAKGDEIYQSDRIESGERASAQLMMVDRARIAVRPSSIFVVAEYHYRGGGGGDSGGGSSVLKIIRGGFRTLSGLIGEENQAGYRVDTPSGQIGLRGTDHLVFYIPEGGESQYGGDAGTYNKVYKGATYLRRDGALLEVDSGSQVGYAPPSGEPRFVPALPGGAEGPAAAAAEERPTAAAEEDEEESDATGDDAPVESADAAQAADGAADDGAPADLIVAADAAVAAKDAADAAAAAEVREALQDAAGDDAIIPDGPDFLPWADPEAAAANLKIATADELEDVTPLDHKVSFNPDNPALVDDYFPYNQGHDYDAGDDTSIFIVPDFAPRFVRAGVIIGEGEPESAFFQVDLNLADGQVRLDNYRLYVEFTDYPDEQTWDVSAADIGVLSEKETVFDVAGTLIVPVDDEREIEEFAAIGGASIAFGEQSLLTEEHYPGIPAFSRFDLEAGNGGKLQGILSGVLREVAGE